MKIKFSTRRVLLWNKETSSMTPRWRVTATLLGYNNSTIMELNPLHATTNSDITEAKSVLADRMKIRWEQLRRVGE